MMKKLQPNEIKLIGEWEIIDGKVIGNDICQRIEQLIDGYLQQVASDTSGWDLLFKDPEDGRYWELTYPQSHMHGGGPPTLECISEDTMHQKYKRGQVSY